MHNRSEDAFKPDVYGDEITIERTINREQGGTTWRLRGKRHGNKIMSTKKAEIDDMCSAMGIQIDNTLTTLSQDQSRAFLANSDAYKKYAVGRDRARATLRDSLLTGAHLPPSSSSRARVSPGSSKSTKSWTRSSGRSTGTLKRSRAACPT